MALRRRVVMDGHSARRALLTRGRPYFSFTARVDLHLHEDCQGCCFFCELSRAEEEEEYLIRCNGITII